MTVNPSPKCSNPRFSPCRGELGAIHNSIPVLKEPTEQSLDHENFPKTNLAPVIDPKSDRRRKHTKWYNLGRLGCAAGGAHPSRPLPSPGTARRAGGAVLSGTVCALDSGPAPL